MCNPHLRLSGAFDREQGAQSLQLVRVRLAVQHSYLAVPACGFI